MSDFPEIKSTHSLVAKHVTPELWAKLSGHKTATSGFTLAQAIACAVQFDDQVTNSILSSNLINLPTSTAASTPVMATRTRTSPRCSTP